MKKVGVLLIFLFLIAFAFVQGETDSDKIDAGISCLEKKIPDCSTLTVPEIAFTLLSPVSSSTKTDCKTALNSKKDSKNCWPSGSCTIKDTALAILALKYNGESTESAESWLLSQNKTPTDLIWYLQQNSETATQCDIEYSGNTYTINIAENKKIDSPAGNCLTLPQSEFWLQVSPNCYNIEFKIECRADFIATLFYKNANSPKFYILSETQSAPQYGEITLKVNSKCFGTTSSCDYEGSLWAALALQETGNNVSSFVPYLIAMSDTNAQYLPNAFIYMITNQEEYATRLIQQQTPQNYWVAGTLYNRFYDTSIALRALGTSSEQASNAQKELLFSQSADGCWGTIRDTAIVLWALRGISKITPSTEDCDTSKFYCIPRADCPESEILGNFLCFNQQGKVCCKSENLKLCSELGGKKCSSDEQCSGNPRKASDGDCCLANCEPKKSECEKRGYFCQSSCSENQESANYTCKSGVCCKLKSLTEKAGFSIIWILIIGIVIVGGIIIYLQRNKLKLFYFKFKNKFKKESGAPASGGYPPRPGFPPIRMPPRQPPRPQPRESSDVFKRLREMTR